jgi:hypothetical protein
MAAPVADQRGQRHARVAAAGGRGDDAGRAYLAEQFDSLAGRRDAGLDVVGRVGGQPLLRHGQSADDGAVLVAGGPGRECDDQGDGSGELPLPQDVLGLPVGVDPDRSRLPGPRDPGRSLGLLPAGHRGARADQRVLEVGLDRQTPAVADLLDPLDRGVAQRPLGDNLRRVEGAPPLEQRNRAV